MDELFKDLLIANNDLVLDPANVPVLTNNRHSIGQDIAHMIRETGLFHALLAERNYNTRNYYLNRLEMLMKDDERLIPSTPKIIDEGNGRYLITATTVDFGDFAITLNGVQIE